MKKNSKSKSAAPKVDPYLEGLMSKLLDRLVSLEKKMDAILSRTESKSSQGPEAKQPQRRDRVLYEAVCADCHKVCEVPFQPSEDRAVYCKECFARRKSGAPAARSGYPVLTPVAMPSKPVSKPPAPAIPTVKKNRPVKKSKKKK